VKRGTSRWPASIGWAAGRTVDLITTTALAVAVVATALMTVIITVEVIGRSFFSFSTLVSDEMSGYLLVILTFFGLADTLRSDSFIRVGLLYERFSPDARRRLDAALLLIALGYTAFLSYHFWRFAADSYRFGTTSTYFTRTPIWIPQACMATGTSLLILAILAALVQRLSTSEAHR
jgi:TRAP-type transport system small permease protein